MLTEGSIRLVQFEYGYTHGDSKFLMRETTTKCSTTLAIESASSVREESTSQSGPMP